MHEEHEEDTNATAVARKLQDAAHGGPPVAIPAAYDPAAAPDQGPPQGATAHPSGAAAFPESEADRADHVLEGGGKH